MCWPGAGHDYRSGRKGRDLGYNLETKLTAFLVRRSKDVCEARDARVASGFQWLDCNHLWQREHCGRTGLSFGQIHVWYLIGIQRAIGRHRSGDGGRRVQHVAAVGHHLTDHCSLTCNQLGGLGFPELLCVPSPFPMSSPAARLSPCPTNTFLPGKSLRWYTPGVRLSTTDL